MKPEKLLQLIKNEWERTVLATICFVGLLIGAFGGLQCVNFFQKEQPPVANTVKVKEAYAAAAFDFVQRDDTVGIAQNHPLTVHPPGDWLSSRKRAGLLAAREAARRAAEQRRAKERVWEEKKRELEKRRKGEVVKKGETQKPPKPNPPIQHYIVFKGFFQHPEAGQLAYLGRQSEQAGVKRSDKPMFVKKDDEFGEYKVDEVDEDVVILKDKQGRSFEVVRGEPYHYRTEQNPAEMLKPNEESKREQGEGARGESKPKKKKTSRGRKTAGERKSKGRQGAGGAAPGGGLGQLQDLLKSGNMKKFSNKDVQKILKGGNISTKEIQDLLKRFSKRKK